MAWASFGSEAAIVKSRMSSMTMIDCCGANLFGKKSGSKLKGSVAKRG